MKMEYRRLTSNDLDAYFEIRLRALQNSPSAFLVSHAEQVKEGRDFFAKTLDDQGDNAVIFGALVDRKVIATLGIFREQRQKIAHKSVIWGMYVEEEFRGRKYSQLLLGEVLKLLPREATYYFCQARIPRALDAGEHCP